MSAASGEVAVIQSAFWQTNTAIITDPDGGIVLIDPGVLPDELRSIARRVGEGRLIAALSTHEDWDHVLWARELGHGAPRLAHPETVRILTDHRETLLTSLTEAERELSVAWDHDLAGRLDPIPQQTVAFGEHIRVTFIPTPGHTDGHASLVLEGEGAIFAGDMLSDVDIPILAETPGSLDAYIRSLDVLQHLLADARTIIPGHGAPCDRDVARQRLDRDRAYVDSLGKGRATGSWPERPIPDDPRWQRVENRETHRYHIKAMAKLRTGPTP